MAETPVDPISPRARRGRRLAAGSVVAVAVAAVGAILVGGLSANAATSPSPDSSYGGHRGSGPGNFPKPGSPEHEALETPVTGATAASAQAAAVAAVGGTAGAVTTDARGGGYEVTVTKTDGSTVEVHLDSTFHVMTPGHGGRPGGGPGGKGPHGSGTGRPTGAPSGAPTGSV